MSIVNNDFYAKIESNLISSNNNLIREVNLPEIDKNILINMYNKKRIENFQDEGEGEGDGEAESEAESEEEAESEAEEEEVAPTPAPTVAPTPAPTTQPKPVVSNYKVSKDVQKLQIQHNEKVLQHCKVRCLKKLEDYKQNKETFENNTIDNVIDNLKDKIKNIINFIF